MLSGVDNNLICNELLAGIHTYLPSGMSLRIGVDNDVNGKEDEEIEDKNSKGAKHEVRRASKKQIVNDDPTGQGDDDGHLMTRKWPHNIAGGKEKDDETSMKKPVEFVAFFPPLLDEEEMEEEEMEDSDDDGDKEWNPPGSKKSKGPPGESMATRRSKRLK